MCKSPEIGAFTINSISFFFDRPSMWHFLQRTLQLQVASKRPRRWEPLQVVVAEVVAKGQLA